MRGRWSDPQPVSDIARRIREGRDVQTPELLALVFGGAGNETVLALHYLKDRYVDGNRDAIRDRAREMLHEQEREIA